MLLAALLVGSLLAPIGAAQPAAATTTQEADGECMYDAVGWWIFDCAEGEGTTIEGTSEVDLHQTSVSEWESMKSTTVSGENYVEDSKSIAFLEARHTVASEWENGSSSSEAWQAAREDIRDYYSFRQSNYLQAYQKSMTQMNYNIEVMNQDPDIEDGFISGPMHAEDTEGASKNPNMDLTNETENVSVELANESTENISVPVMDIKHRAEIGVTGTASGNIQLPIEPFEHWEYDEDEQEFSSKETVSITMYDGDETTTDVTSVSPLMLNVMSVADSDLESERVWDTREIYELWLKTEEASTQATGSFPQSAVEDLYEGLDSGEIDPSDVRGPEGQMRYMSGDAEAQEGAYTLALYQTMGIGSPDLSNVSEMEVSYTGNTTKEMVGTADNLSRSYTDPVNETYTGILFADEPPEGGFESGETYNASALNGSIEMVPFEGDPVSFYDGNFTIESMTDSDGNDLESADWSGPEPESYNSEDFVRYTEQTTEARETIIKQVGDSGSGGEISIPDVDDLLEDYGTGAMVGGVVLAVTLFLVLREFAKAYLP